MVIACMPRKDLHKNLKNLTAIYKDQVKDLQKKHWKKKKIRLFLCGDYAFLSAMYGLSGAKGTYFCLRSLTKSEDIRFPSKSRSPATQRTLVALKHHTKFIKKGGGKVNLASCYHNVIREPLWDIKINQTCPPYLHILLGIVKSHHNLLEKELHEVDLQIAQRIMLSNAKLGPSSFHVYIQNVRERKKLRNPLLFLEAEMSEDQELTKKEKKEEDSRIKTLKSKQKKTSPYSKYLCWATGFQSSRCFKTTSYSSANLPLPLLCGKPLLKIHKANCARRYLKFIAKKYVRTFR